MLHAGLDLGRRKLHVCLLSDQGEHLDQLAVPADVDSLRTLAQRIDEVYGEPACAVVESMTGARLVHDTLEQEGWSVEIADAQKVKGLAPLTCKTDTIDSLVLATGRRRAFRYRAVMPVRSLALAMRSGTQDRRLSAFAPGDWWHGSRTAEQGVPRNWGQPWPWVRRGGGSHRRRGSDSAQLAAGEHGVCGRRSSCEAWSVLRSRSGARGRLTRWEDIR